MYALEQEKKVKWKKVTDLILKVLDVLRKHFTVCQDSKREKPASIYTEIIENVYTTYKYLTIFLVLK